MTGEVGLCGLHDFLGPFFHFLGRYIFNVRCDTPEVSPGIADETGTVSIELVLNWLENFCPGRNSALNYAVDIGEIKIEAYRA